MIDKLKKVLLLVSLTFAFTGCLIPSETRTAAPEELGMEIEYAEPVSFGSFYSEAGELEPPREQGEDDLGYLLFMDDCTRNPLMAYLDSLTGSDEISWAIVKASVKHDIPLQLSFALAFAESSYNSEAVNYNEITIDRGLFQLNNRSFPHLEETDFFDPVKNADYGIAYLKHCLKRAGNEVTALAMYNAGPARVTDRGAPERTLHYIDKVFDYAEEMKTNFRAISQDPSLSFNFSSAKRIKQLSFLTE